MLIFLAWLLGLPLFPVVSLLFNHLIVTLLQADKHVFCTLQT